MIRFFSFNHPFTYGVLFLLAVALRLPSFHPQYIAADEASYLTAAERIVEGGIQYVDTWDNKPPVIIWFYSLFVFVFGSHALLALRIFTVLYLFFTAILLSQIINDHKLIRKFSLIPAFIFLLLSSVPWYAQELNAELLMLLPVLVAYYQLFSLQEREGRNYSSLFVAGMLMGLCIMIKYQAVFLFLGLLLAYLVIQTPRLEEIFSLISGFILIVAAIFIVVQFSGALPEFWDIGVVYNLDYLTTGANPGEKVSPLANLLQYARLWGVFLIMAIAGIAHYRVTYFKNTIRLRKIEAVIFIWLIASLLTVAIGFGRLYLHYFILVVPPLTVYVSKFFDLNLRGWIRFIAFSASMAFPVFTYVMFLLAAFPDSFSFADRYLNIRPVNTKEVFVDPYFESEPMGWVQTHRMLLNEPDPLEQYIDRSKIRNGILILDFLPQHYVRLDVPCATRYTNFSIAWYKMVCLRHNEGRSLFSNNESETEIYKAFSMDMPEYIIDPHGIFPQLEQCLPLLFKGYKGIDLNYYKLDRGTYRIYERIQ